MHTLCQTHILTWVRAVHAHEVNHTYMYVCMCDNNTYLNSYPIIRKALYSRLSLN